MKDFKGLAIGRRSVLLLLILTGSFFTHSQTINYTRIIQESLNSKVLYSHIRQQQIFDTLTNVIFKGDSVSATPFHDYYFLDQQVHIKYYTAESVQNWNIELVSLTKHHDTINVVYYFYPNWNDCGDALGYLSYSNALFFKVNCLFTYLDNDWIFANETIEDIKFESWMIEAGYGCIIESYRHL